MGKRYEIHIKESLEELHSLRKKAKSHRLKTRLQCLILTKENKFKTREDLAEHIGIGVSSLYRWTKTYSDLGIESMLKISTGGNQRKVVTANVHQGLEKKLHDSTNPLLGYWDAVIWVRNEYKVDLKYQTLRSYMIRHWGTKLKSPRKSHYKKDEQAIEAFKKTP